jgi:hypothetical protein
MQAMAALAGLTWALAAVPAQAEMNLLHSCAGKAAIGAGAGAVLGGMVAGKGAKTEGALLGAAVGGLGTYGVCRYIDTRASARIDKAYKYAAATGKPYTTSWTTKQGVNRLRIAQPVRDGAHCKILNATLSVGGGARQSLPQETYCRASNGKWNAA